MDYRLYYQFNFSRKNAPMNDLSMNANHLVWPLAKKVMAPHQEIGAPSITETEFDLSYQDSKILIFSTFGMR